MTFAPPASARPERQDSSDKVARKRRRDEAMAAAQAAAAHASRAPFRLAAPALDALALAGVRSEALARAIAVESKVSWKRRVRDV